MDFSDDSDDDMPLSRLRLYNSDDDLPLSHFRRSDGAGASYQNQSDSDLDSELGSDSEDAPESSSSSDEANVTGAVQPETPIPANDGEWCNAIVMPVGTRFKGAAPGPSFDMTEDKSYLDYFQLFATNDFLSQIISFTNQNYNSLFSSFPDKHKSKWDPLSLSELKAVIAIMFSAGLMQVKGSFRKMWQVSCSLTRLEGIREVMPRDRFLQIVRYLHFVNESTALTDKNDENYDPFYKVNFFFSNLIPKFQLLYNPKRDISLDEGMIKAQGRVPCRQFIANKPIRFGLKVYILAESSTGYIFNLELYKGKWSKDTTGNGKTFSVVDRLVEPYKNKGHALYTDNYYTSVDLFEYLQTQGTDCCGTVRANRKHLPKSIVNKKQKTVKKLKPGQALFLQKDQNMICVSWKDNKLVTLISTLPIANEMDLCRRKKKINDVWNTLHIPRPAIIHAYNQNMGGVDLANRKINVYKKQISTIRWPMRVFWYMLDICVLNSYVIYTACQISKNLKPVKLREFREQLAVQLIGGNTFVKHSHNYASNNADRMNRNLEHAPMKMAKQSHCYVHRQRVDTMYTCGACKVRMCIVPCFHRWHYMQNFEYDDPERQGKTLARKKRRN